MIRVGAKKIDNKWVVLKCPICGASHIYGSEKDPLFNGGNRIVTCGPFIDTLAENKGEAANTFMVVLEGYDQVLGFG